MTEKLFEYRAVRDANVLHEGKIFRADNDRRGTLAFYNTHNQDITIVMRGLVSPDLPPITINSFLSVPGAPAKFPADVSYFPFLKCDIFAGITPTTGNFSLYYLGQER